MFTGIIEEVGTVASIKKGANSAVLTIQARTILDDVKLGDSIAVNGVCLTVTALTPSAFCRRCYARNTEPVLTGQAAQRQHRQSGAGHGSQRTVWRSYRQRPY